MRYIGLCVIVFAVLLVWRGYCAYLAECSTYSLAFLRALRDYREKMKCYLVSPCEWANGFSDGALSDIGFLDRVKNGETLFVAYQAIRQGIFLPKRIDEALLSCFERLGEGYLDTELETLEGAIAEIEREEKALSEDVPRRQKAVGALLGACVVGGVILII